MESKTTNKEWYKLTQEEVLLEKKSCREGLTEDKAKSLLEEMGENVLIEGKKKSVFRIFAEQFLDLLVIILIIAAIISMLSGNVESTVVIFAVIIMNAVLGTVEHQKAEKSLDSLKSMSTPSTRVIRGGKKVEISSREVVEGDIVVLEAGDLVPADGRIIDNFSLQVNESSLTGESTNVDKNSNVITDDVPLADRTNMVYSGSLVTYGRALVVVTQTGMNTEIGKIASLMNATKDKRTPLQISLDQFSKKLAMLIMVICVIVFGLSLYRDMPVLDSLMFAVALAVAAIPEALSSIVTIVQAMGTQKMAKQNAIIKDLKAVESLGCVSVICSDKTGTLTQNKMTVQEIYMSGSTFKPEELDIKNQLHRYLLYDCILTNDSRIVEDKGIGDPTEFCLIAMSRKINLNDEAIRDMMERIEEIPFDSDRKLMSTRYNIHGVPTLLTKGAIDNLLDRSVNIRTNEGIRPMTDKDREEILAKNKEFSENGLRVLTFAYREIEENEHLSIESERDYTFIGLISMIDPPREESIQAVADAKSAGIRPVMITGDHKITATAIARQIGIFCEGDMALTGAELDALTDEELDNDIEKISVYARVSPENKIRIVDAWQKKGRIVAMTGDGVNDAPALKKADIGVAMGITGTEVSKDAASMILTDDNFATIIKAVGNGRNVYRNISNAVRFLISGNMAGILVVLFASIMALPAPFAPVHLLFINLLTDSLPALAIGMEPGDRDLLKNKPRSPKEGILTKDFLKAITLQGALIGISTVIAFYIGLEKNAAVASTMAFCTLTLARLFHGFNCRGKKSIVKLGFKSNKYSIWAFIAGVIMLTLVMFVPFLQTLFIVEGLTLVQIGFIYLLAFVPTALIQLKRILL